MRLVVVPSRRVNLTGFLPGGRRGEGRNRPDFPAVAPQICLILLGIQAIPALSGHILFNRFGVRLINAVLLRNGCDSAMKNISVR